MNNTRDMDSTEIIVSNTNNDAEQTADKDNTTVYEESVVNSDKFYSTGEVASMLSINRDLVLYYAKPFLDYLHFERTGSGPGSHWRIPGKDIEVLRSIIRMRKEGKSDETIKAILEDPGMSLLLGEGNKLQELLATMLTKQSEVLHAHFQHTMESFIKEHSQQLLIQEQSQKNLLEQNQQLASQVEQLSKEVSDLSILLEERLPEKKRGLFSFIKK